MRLSTTCVTVQWTQARLQHSVTVQWTQALRLTYLLSRVLPGSLQLTQAQKVGCAVLCNSKEADRGRYQGDCRRQHILHIVARHPAHDVQPTHCDAENAT